MMASQQAADAAFAGAFGALGLYHLVHYAARRRERAFAWLALLCLVTAARSALEGTGGHLAQALWPGLPGPAAVTAIEVLLHAAVALLTAFMAALYPDTAFAGLARATWAVAAALTALALVAPAWLAGRTVLAMEAWALGLSGLSLALLWRAASAGREDAGLVLAGLGFFLVFGIHDILADNGALGGPLLFPVGVLGLVVALAVALARRVDRALAVESRLARELGAKNEALERARLSPHFLFNAFSSIRGALAADPGRARQMLSDLADYCRRVLAQADRQVQPVAEELELARLYLAMEQARWGEGLVVAVELDPAVARVAVPAHLLQPLVENAVKYGARTSPESLRVEVGVGPHGASGLALSVRNSGRWVAPGELELPSTGTGLASVRRRLALAYPGRHEVVQEEAGGRVSVTLILQGVRAEPAA